MSGTKTSRTDLKNRFKKGMYPTEGDFANVFESYLHKDDDISMSKVVLTDGDGNTTTLNNVIGNKADKTDLTEITNRLTTAENDIDTAEDNIAGHETRIKSLEAFKERVRAFLEDADASEETINRWHEIESFLQGITDTQTLTGLLNDLKQEILQSIPQSQQGNYLQLIDDLDAYTDAPVGTIVKYTGPTNDKYTHGFDYEKVQSGQGSSEPKLTVTLRTFGAIPDVVRQAMPNDSTPFVMQGSIEDYVEVKCLSTDQYSGGSRFFYFKTPIEVGDAMCPEDGSGIYHVTSIDPVAQTVTIDLNGGTVLYDRIGTYYMTPFVSQSGETVLILRVDVVTAIENLQNQDDFDADMVRLCIPSKNVYYDSNEYDGVEENPHCAAGFWYETPAAPASWQPSKSMSVID